MSVDSTTATNVSLSWSVPSGSVVDSYEVMWWRNASGKCHYEDKGSIIIAGDSISLIIMELEEDSPYTITVVARNPAGSALISAVTEEAGEFSHILLPILIVEINPLFLVL